MPDADWPVNQTEAVTIFGGDYGRWELLEASDGTKQVHLKEGFITANPIRTNKCVVEGYAGDPRQFIGWDTEIWAWLVGFLNGNSAPTFGLTIHNSTLLSDAEMLYCIGWGKIQNLPGWDIKAINFAPPTTCNGGTPAPTSVPFQAKGYGRPLRPSERVKTTGFGKPNRKGGARPQPAVQPTEELIEILPNGDPTLAPPPTEAPPPPPAEPTADPSYDWHYGTFQADWMVECDSCDLDEPYEGWSENGGCKFVGFKGHGYFRRVYNLNNSGPCNLPSR